MELEKKPTHSMCFENVIASVQGMKRYVENRVYRGSPTWRSSLISGAEDLYAHSKNESILFLESLKQWLRN
jgi:hypothetical protein